MSHDEITHKPDPPIRPFSMSRNSTSLTLKLSIHTEAYKELARGAYIKYHDKTDIPHIRVIAHSRIKEGRYSDRALHDPVYGILTLNKRKTLPSITPEGFAVFVFPLTKETKQMPPIDMALADIPGQRLSPGLWVFAIPKTWRVD